VDPEGLLIPAAVMRRLANVTSEEDVWHLARIGRVYDVGGRGLAHHRETGDRLCRPFQ